MTPRPRAALALGVAAAVALVAGATAGLLTAGGVLIAALLDMWLARRPTPVERIFPPTVPRGYPVPFLARATSRPGLRVDLRQPLPPDLEAAPAVGRQRIDGTVVAHRRGSHTLPPLAIRTEGPLGLGAITRRGATTQNVAVYPDVVTARRLARAVATGRFSTEGRRRGPLLGLGTEFESIRDYAPDDDIRQVNWTATARLGRPMSNQYRIDQDRNVICVVDTGRLMAAPLGRMTRLDAAVDAATSVAYVADQLGDRAGLLAFDATILRRLEPKRRGGDGVVRGIYDLEPSDRESDYRKAFQAVARMKRALVMVFTDLLEETAARPLLEAVPVLGRTHTVVVASSRDDDLLSAIGTEPSNVDDVYRAAVAADAIAAKSRVAHRLRHLGAVVVEAGHDTLPAACVNAYLDAKRKARL